MISVLNFKPPRVHMIKPHHIHVNMHGHIHTIHTHENGKGLLERLCVIEECLLLEHTQGELVCDVSSDTLSAVVT